MLSKAVQLSLGPRGRNVTIDPWSPEMQSQNLDLQQLQIQPKPIVTKDGVTIAQHINVMGDPLESIGAKILIDAAERANEEPKTDAAAMPENTERNIEVNMIKRRCVRTGRN